MTSCGTYACFAGWFALVTLGDSVLENKGYSSGVAELDRYLGFRGFPKQSESRFKEWARSNPDLWDNYHGRDMFVAKEAFYNADERPRGAVNLFDVVEHLDAVADRIETEERKNG